MRTKTIRLSRIKINGDMRNSMPRPVKMKYKYIHYLTTGEFQSKIRVNRRNVLVDGYTSYPLAKMFDVKKVEIIYVD